MTEIIMSAIAYPNDSVDVNTCLISDQLQWKFSTTSIFNSHYNIDFLLTVVTSF